MLKGAILLTGV